MAGTFSVEPAKPGSTEIENNKIGVEFKVKISHSRVFGALYVRKVGNGTILFEVVTGIRVPYDRLLISATRIFKLALTLISSLQFLPGSLFHHLLFAP